MEEYELVCAPGRHFGGSGYFSDPLQFLHIQQMSLKHYLW